MKSIVLFGTLLALATTASAGETETSPLARVLRKEIVIHAPLDAVWRAWTSEEGLAPISSSSRIELRPGGDYAWFLETVDEQGRRGSEGSEIVSFVPRERLVFRWTFPPSTPGLRAAQATTEVAVHFDEAAEGGVRLELVATGWQEGAEWDQAYEYFDRAWGWVLGAMKEHLEADLTDHHDAPTMDETMQLLQPLDLPVPPVDEEETHAPTPSRDLDPGPGPRARPRGLRCARRELTP